MIKRLIVVMTSVALSAATAQAAINSTGDVDPPDPATWTSSTDAFIGLTGEGSVAVDDDSDLLSGSGILGFAPGSTGAVTVDGAGSTWTNSNYLYVACLGQAALDITDGGAVTSSDVRVGYATGSTGAVTVDGAGSTWTNPDYVYLGYLGDATLDITAGGAVSSWRAYLGQQAGSTAVVTVDGAGSTWTSSDFLYVGLSGDGTLNVTDGGAASSLYASLGYNNSATGSATVSGAGSTWTNSDTLQVGFYGNATLDIAAGGTVSCDEVYIGCEPGATGVVTVSGAGSTWTSTDVLRVGVEGSGTLNITDGGAVEVAVDTYVARYAGSSGVIAFDNGTLTTAGLLTAPDDLIGTGTINTSGLVSNMDLAFDAAHGLTQTVILNEPEQNIALSFDVDGSGSMGAGYSGSGTTHVSDGVVVQSTYGYLGYHAGSTGVMTVDGAGSAWTISDDLFIGREGEGTLSIANGGTVNNAQGHIGFQSGSTGAVTVSGAGSAWTCSDYLYVGKNGDATLNITDGGAVNTYRHSHIGRGSGSTGTVTVSGAGSTWSPNDLSVGQYGTGTLNVLDGGQAAGRGLAPSTVAAEPGSVGTVTVSGAGSTWTRRHIHVGEGGTGTLNVLDGGQVIAGNTCTVAAEPGSVGTITVSGAGSAFSSGEGSYVGRGGSATMSITNGGAVTSEMVHTSYDAGSTSVVTVSGTGSTWDMTRLLAAVYSSGRLQIDDGGMVNVEYDAFLYSGNTLGIGLSGAGVESCLNVGGEATLAGALEISLIGGFLPFSGTEFLIVDAGSLVGTFDSVTFPSVPSDLWHIEYDRPAGDVIVGFPGPSIGDFDGDYHVDDVDIDLLADAIRTGSTDFDTFDISADGTTRGADGVIDTSDLDYLVRFLVETTVGSGAEYGDFNLDGTVDITDLTRLSTDYGSGDTWAQGNANRNVDLVTDVTDLTILSTYYGFGAPDTVPEPATLGLLAIGGVGLLRRKRLRSL